MLLSLLISIIKKISYFNETITKVSKLKQKNIACIHLCISACFNNLNFQV